MMYRIFLVVATIGALTAGVVHAEDVNPVVGKAGDFVLREADMERLIGTQSQELQKKLQQEPEQRVSLIRQLLLSRAVAARARKEGFDRKPEVKEQLSYVIDEYIAQEYLHREVTGKVVVPEEEMKKFYQDNAKDFRLPLSVKARQIFIATSKDATPEARAQARKKADDILLRVKKGEDFAALAGTTSEDKDSAEKGGDIGYLSPGKTNSEEFEKAVFALKAGETGALVETSFGYHIVRIDERKEERPATFDEAREYIRSKLAVQLEQKKGQEFIDQLVKDAGLQVFEDKIVGTREQEKKPVQ